MCCFFEDFINKKGLALKHYWCAFSYYRTPITLDKLKRHYNRWIFVCNSASLVLQLIISGAQLSRYFDEAFLLEENLFRGSSILAQVFNFKNNELCTHSITRNHNNFLVLIPPHPPLFFNFFTNTIDVSVKPLARLIFMTKYLSDQMDT